MTFPTVPVAPNGLEGWTSCCGAAVTFSDVALCCKACWNEVDTVCLDGPQGEALGTILDRVIRGEMTATEGVAAQRALLGSCVPYVPRTLAVADLYLAGTSEPFSLEAGEQVLWIRDNGDGSAVVRIRTAAGVEDVVDADIAPVSR